MSAISSTVPFRNIGSEPILDITPHNANELTEDVAESYAVVKNASLSTEARTIAINPAWSRSTKITFGTTTPWERSC